MTLKCILLATLLAIANATPSNFDYSNYLNSYSTSNFDNFGYNDNYNYEYTENYPFSHYNPTSFQLSSSSIQQSNYHSQPLVSSYSSYPSYSESSYVQPQTYSTPYTSSVHHQPDVYEYSTHLQSHGGVTKTRITPQAPLIQETYTPSVVHKSVEPAPYTTQYSSQVPLVHNDYRSEPTVSQYSTYSAPLVQKTIEPVVASAPASVKTISHEPTISEYSTLVKTAPAFTKTEVKPQPPIVHESYIPPVEHKTLVPGPIVQKTVEAVQHAPIVQKTIEPVVVNAPASVKTISHEPTISEYSTYTASAPAFTKTEVKPQPPIVHESYIPPVEHKTLVPGPIVQKTVETVQSAPIVQKTIEPVVVNAPASVKTISHEPTVSEFSTYTASAPAFTKTDVKPQPPIVHESYVPGFVHKTLEAGPVVRKTVEAVAAPVQQYAAPVQTVAHQPAVAEYSTYSAAAPAVAKTDVYPQPPLVQRQYNPGFVQKSFGAAPVVSSYSSTNGIKNW